MNYEKYKADMKKFKQVPMSEEQFNLMQGIGEKETPPFLARKSSSHKAITPSLANHSLAKPSSKPQLKVNLLDKVRIVKESQPKKNNGTDLSGLSAEEKRAYHNERALKKYHANKSPNVRVKMSDEERKQKRYEYEKSRREKMKAEGTWFRAKPTEEQKLKLRAYKEKKRREDGINPRTKMSEEEKKAKLLQQSKEWRQRCKEKGIKRVLTHEQRDRYNANYRAKAKLKREQK